MRCNYETDWDYLPHIVVMGYDIFPYTPTDECPFFLMYRQDVYLPMCTICYNQK